MTVAFFFLFFKAHFLNIPPSGVLKRCLVVVWLPPREAAALLAHVLCTPRNQAPVYSVTSCIATYVGCVLINCDSPSALLAE